MPLPPPCRPPDFAVLETSRETPDEVFVIVGGKAEPGRTRYHRATVAWRDRTGQLLTRVHTAVDDLGAAAFIGEAIARIGRKWDDARIRLIVDIGRWATGVIVPCPPPRMPTPPIEDDLFGHLLRDLPRRPEP